MTAEEVLTEVAASDVSLEAVMYLRPILEGIHEMTEEEEAFVKDVVSQISGGLEMLRDELGMPWKLAPLSRIKELSLQIAELVPEWNVNESFLVGTFLAASARRQLVEQNGGVAQPDPADRAATLAAIAASANQTLAAENSDLRIKAAQVDDLKEIAHDVLLGKQLPQALISAVMKIGEEQDV